MSNYFNKGSCTYINSIKHAMKHSIIQIKYYQQTGDIRFFNESNDWLSVAEIYMNQIVKETIHD